METIIYQGQEVQATLVNYLSGRLPTSTVDHEGDEDLFRDEEGRYYLRRRLDVLDAEGERRRTRGRTHVHRINVNAAILWATTRLNSETLCLRQDAADLLMEGRKYFDPSPTHLSAEQRAMVSDPERFAKQREQQAGSGRITVELDDLASAMLRKVCRQGSATRHPGEDLRDLVNAAVTFYLCVDDNDQHGEFDLNCSSDALERAKHDHLSLAAAEQVPPAATFGRADGPEPVETQPGVHRFVFDYPATTKVCGRQRTIEVSDMQMARASELAAHFDLAPAQFLSALADHNNLPGQPRRLDDKLENLLQAQHLAFVCMDEAMAKRIKRAAQARCQTTDEFVAYAVGSDVDMWEEAMLVHPATGELLEADYEELYTEDERAYQLTAPPVGREDDPWFLADQQAKAEPDGMTVRLEAKASSLVRRYLDTTPFNYTASDIVGGSVTYALGQAFDNQDEAEEFGKLDGAEFHEGAWGYVEEKIYDAQRRRSGATTEPATGAKEATA